MDASELPQVKILAREGDAVALSRLINHVLATEGFDAAADIFREHQNVSGYFEDGYCHFISYKPKYANERTACCKKLIREGRTKPALCQ
jgi:hypothetical protein